MSGGRSPFADRVLQVVAATRPGEVVSYADVAREAGSPHAARAVGRVLSRHGDTVAWWRVVAASGRLAPGKEELQRRHLEREGRPCDADRVVVERPE